MIPKKSNQATGDQDRFIPDCVLVPLDRKSTSFPAVNQDRTPPGTYYRFSKKRQVVICMLTVSPHGVHVAWDMCGECGSHFRRCSCQKGVCAPPSIAHIAEWAPVPRTSRFDLPMASPGVSNTVPKINPAVRKSLGDRPKPTIAELDARVGAVATDLVTTLRDRLRKIGGR